VFQDGDFYKAVRWTGDLPFPVVVWFSTGKQKEEILARAIAKKLCSSGKCA
jgi:hypothetical protein